MKLKIENSKSEILSKTNGLKIPAKRAGMTLFIAVVIMSILLFISFAVINIAITGTIFASLGRDSQYAFYAADAGIECALYWDTKFDPSKFDPSADGSPINCAGTSISTDTQSVPTNPPQSSIIGGDKAINNPISPNTSIFYFDLNQGLNTVPYCAIVTVTKDSVLGTTHIYSKGYNTCDTSNPRRVERGLEVNY